MEIHSAHTHRGGRMGCDRTSGKWRALQFTYAGPTQRKPKDSSPFPRRRQPCDPRHGPSHRCVSDALRHLRWALKRGPFVLRRPSSDQAANSKGARPRAPLITGRLPRRLLTFLRCRRSRGAEACPQPSARESGTTPAAAHCAGAWSAAHAPRNLFEHAEMNPKRALVITRPCWVCEFHGDYGHNRCTIVIN